MSHSQTQTPYCYNHLIIMYKNEILVVWLLNSVASVLTTLD